MGSYALRRAICEAQPDHIVAAEERREPDHRLGIGEGQTFLASDIPAILPYTRQMLFLEDGEFAVLDRGRRRCRRPTGTRVEREPKPIQWDPVSAEKGGYDRFMQKEIFEQPRAIMDTIGTRVPRSRGRRST